MLCVQSVIFWYPACRAKRTHSRGHPFHPPGNRSFGNVKTEHKNFSVDARSSPSRVLRRHLANEIPDLFRCPSSPDGLLNFRNHAPVPTESSPVPSDHRFRSDHNQDLFPSGGPEHVRQNPKGLIEYCEPWPGMPSLQRCELLAKSQVFKKQLAPSAEHANRSEQKRKQVHLSCCYRILLVEEKGVSC